MKLTIKKAQRRLDRLWQTIGKEKARCEVCVSLPPWDQVSYTQLHPHHVIGRRNLTLRWDLKNRVWLCPTHHAFGKMSAHNDPVWFLDWFATNRPGDWEHIRNHKDIIIKRTLDDYLRLIEGIRKKG